MPVCRKKDVRFESRRTANGVDVSVVPANRGETMAGLRGKGLCCLEQTSPDPLREKAPVDDRWPDKCSARRELSGSQSHKMGRHGEKARKTVPVGVLPSETRTEWT